jgi:arylformamidase
MPGPIPAAIRFRRSAGKSSAWAAVLKGEGVSARYLGARESTHNKINADLGLPDDPGTKAMFAFIDAVLKK